MTAENRRVIRMLCKAMLIISLPLTGFVWALPENSAMLPIALALTLLSVAVGFGAEVLASSTENELQVVSQRAVSDTQRRSEELAMQDEKLRQFDRIVNLLTEQNHTLRSKLISAQMTLQRHVEGLDTVEASAAGLEDFVPANAGYASAAH